MSDEKPWEDVERRKRWLDEPADSFQSRNPQEPRHWLAFAATEAMDGQKKLGGDREWLYTLAVTMIPEYPEIVLDMVENGPDDVTFTFDWQTVNYIWWTAVRELILERGQ